jgi:hypothetical protein
MPVISHTKLRKKKPTPMEWVEIKDIKFTDKQWNDINRHIHLLDEARPLIERMVSIYPFHKRNHEGAQTRKEALAEIEILKKKTDSLKYSFSKIGHRSYYALLDSGVNMDSQSKRQIWNSRFCVLEEILAAVDRAEKDVHTQKPAKRGPKSSALNILVKQLNNLVLQHCGYELDRGSKSRQFLALVVSVIDKDVKDGAFDAALKRIALHRSSASRG